MTKSKFQFSNPRIIKNVFVVNEEILPYDSKEYAVGMEGTTEIKRKQDQNIAAVIFTVIVNKDENHMKDNKLPFYACMTATAEFAWDDCIEESQLEQFLRINAPSLLVSYIRAQMAYNTAQAGFPAFHMPFIDFSKDLK